MKTSTNHTENNLLNAFDFELMNILKSDLNMHYFNQENKAILFSTRKYDEQLKAVLLDDISKLKNRNITTTISMVA